MKKRILTYQLIFLILLTSKLLSQSPEAIGSQWLFSAENDSIQISDITKNGSSYLFVFHANWSNQSKEQLEIFKSNWESWQNQYRLEIILINDFYEDSIDSALEMIADYPFQKMATKNIRDEIDILKFPTSFFYLNDKLILQNESIRTKETWEAAFNKYAKFDIHKNLQVSSKQNISLSFDECDQVFSNIHLENEDTLNNSFDVLTLFEGFELQENETFERVKVSSPSNNFFITMYRFDVTVCQVIKIFSPLIEELVEIEITDIYTKDDRKYIVTDLPFNTPQSNCPDSPNFLTFISGVGTNAGLFPIFDNSRVYSKLLCAVIDEEQVYLHNDDPNNCILSHQQNPKLSDFSDISIFPNPSSDQIHINGIDHELSRIVIYDVQGKMCKEIIGNQQTISIVDLTPGIYHVSLFIGHKKLHRKFIKL